MTTSLNPLSPVITNKEQFVNKITKFEKATIITGIVLGVLTTGFLLWYLGGFSWEVSPYIIGGGFLSISSYYAINKIIYQLIRKKDITSHFDIKSDFINNILTDYNMKTKSNIDTTFECSESRNNFELKTSNKHIKQLIEKLEQFSSTNPIANEKAQKLKYVFSNEGFWPLISGKAWEVIRGYSDDYSGYDLYDHGKVIKVNLKEQSNSYLISFNSEFPIIQTSDGKELKTRLHIHVSIRIDNEAEFRDFSYKASLS